MVGITEFSALLTSLKSAKDIAEAMVSLRDTAAFQGKVIEFQNAIMDAQERVLAAQNERSSLVEKVAQLEQEVARLKAWGSEKQNYHLQRVYPGSFAYALKPDAKSTEPPHWLCANCYGNGQKGILQSKGLRGRDQFWGCPICNNEIKTGFRTAPDSPYVSATSSSADDTSTAQ